MTKDKRTITQAVAVKIWGGDCRARPQMKTEQRQVYHYYPFAFPNTTTATTTILYHQYFSRYRSKHTSAKPAGSQFTDDCCELNGIGSGPSPPTYPLANSLSDVLVVVAVCVEGANADADATSDAAARMQAVFMVIVGVIYFGRVVCVTSAVR
mmetsp:Transcript_5563/g.13418  ORF Transcript_5563/g.13418 Transcript_5563/m.13418 type:complete len:153 (-) Transcript_5563:24-482(-)